MVDYFVLYTSDLLVIVLLCLNVVFFVLGYIVGKIQIPIEHVNYNPNTKSYNHNKTINNRSKIDIDTTKIVTKINTENLEKKYSDLGDIQTKADNIESSINKLKHMKG
jgi:hypothetical protein